MVSSPFVVHHGFKRSIRRILSDLQDDRGVVVSEHLCEIVQTECGK